MKVGYQITGRGTQACMAPCPTPASKKPVVQTLEPTNRKTNKDSKTRATDKVASKNSNDCTTGKVASKDSKTRTTDKTASESKARTTRTAVKPKTAARVATRKGRA